MGEKQTRFLDSSGKVDGAVVSQVRETDVTVEVKTLLGMNGEPDPGLIKRIMERLKSKRAKSVVEAVEQIRE